MKKKKNWIYVDEKYLMFISSLASFVKRLILVKVYLEVYLSDSQLSEDFVWKTGETIWEWKCPLISIGELWTF